MKSYFCEHGKSWKKVLRSSLSPQVVLISSKKKQFRAVFLKILRWCPMSEFFMQQKFCFFLQGDKIIKQALISLNSVANFSFIV